jgi:hypothetical protein
VVHIEKRNAHRILVEKREGKGPLARARSRPTWQYNIKMNLKKVGMKGVDWIIWLRIGTGGGLL